VHSDVAGPVGGRRSWLPLFALAAVLCGCGGPIEGPTSPQASAAASPAPAASTGPPNIVVIVADDMGFADLSCYGAPLTKTPNLDRMASEGVRFSQFVVTSPLCTPSRGSLITGLYPPRTGLIGNLPSGYPNEVIDSGVGSGGIRSEDVTLAEALHDRGYFTAAVGKWHMGSQAQYLPLRHGFDTYFGLPSGENVNLVVRGETLAKNPPALEELTRSYTTEAISAIKTVGKSRPFFLYVAYKAPHIPLAVAGEFLGRSKGGLYGDVVEELDWGVGEILKALSEVGVERNTFVFFMSDNGPWLAKGSDAGSAGPLRAGKGTPLEGGIRVPGIAWWPGRAKGGRVLDEPVISIDIFPTAVAMAGGRLPDGQVYYGRDLTGLLTGDVPRLTGSGIDGSRELLTYVAGVGVGIRSGRWKYLRDGFWEVVPTLFDLQTDIGESTSLISARPDIATQLEARLWTLADQISQGVPKPAQ
jgi:arylsulfatase A